MRYELEARAVASGPPEPRTSNAIFEAKRGEILSIKNVEKSRNI
jgi:hypothetical protein